MLSKRSKISQIFKYLSISPKIVSMLKWTQVYICYYCITQWLVDLIIFITNHSSLPQALLQLPYLDNLYGYGLKLLRLANTSTLASLIRADWTFYSSHPALFLSTYLAHGLFINFFEKKRRCGIRNQDGNTTNLEWLASLWDWYISYLLHPITSLQQVPSDHSDWDDDPEFLFERLAFPDLWLHPLVNTDYIKSLPTWTFRAFDPDRSDGFALKLDEETHFDTNSRKKNHSPLLSPSSPHSSCKRFKRLLSSENTDPASARAFPCSGHERAFSTSAHNTEGNSYLTSPGASDHQHCRLSMWPCDFLKCSECVVCLEAFVSEELLMGLPCGHAFHQQCIVMWLAAGRHCCPVCRWPSYKRKPLRATQSRSPENIQ